MYDRQALIDLVRSRALKFGDFTLASGKKAKYYLDGKQVTLDSRGVWPTKRSSFAPAISPARRQDHQPVEVVEPLPDFLAPAVGRVRRQREVRMGFDYFAAGPFSGNLGK